MIDGPDLRQSGKRFVKEKVMTEKAEKVEIPAKPSDKKLENYQRSGRLWEILSVFAFIFFFLLGWQGWKSGSALEVAAAILAFGFGIVALFAAANFEAKSNLALESITNKSLYLISHHRIVTLEQVKAPEDVTLFLKTIQQSKPISQSQLLAELRRALGSERTNEIKNLVLKYTKLDDEATV